MRFLLLAFSFFIFFSCGTNNTSDFESESVSGKCFASCATYGSTACAEISFTTTDSFYFSLDSSQVIIEGAIGPGIGLWGEEFDGLNIYDYRDHVIGTIKFTENSLTIDHPDLQESELNLHGKYTIQMDSVCGL